MMESHGISWDLLLSRWRWNVSICRSSLRMDMRLPSQFIFRFWRSLRQKQESDSHCENNEQANIKPQSKRPAIIRLCNYSTLSETNSSPLIMDGWNTTFLLRCHIFRGELLVSGRVVSVFLVSWGAIRWLAVSLQQQIHAHDHREGFRDCRCCHIQWIIAWWNPSIIPFKPNKLATIVV